MSLSFPLAPSDSLPTRKAGIWTKEKLNILNCYLNGFVIASRKAGGCCYADGFAGPGVNVIKETGERVCGSPLISLNYGVTTCVFVEFQPSMAKALSERTSKYGERAKVKAGDCNIDLVPLMKKLLDHYKPWLCLLDPEGSNLSWRTVESISRAKRKGTKPELLILLPVDMGFVRTLFLARDLEEWAEVDMLKIFGNENWRHIYEDRRQGMNPDEARTRYVQLYAKGLKELGYGFVLDRQIKTPEGRPLYFLIFATDHPTGRKLMDHCFDRLWPPDEGQLGLFTKQDRNRRLLD